MSNIEFSVGIPSGELTGYVNGEDVYIGSYIAQNVTGYSLQNDQIWCVSPTSLAIQSSATYAVEPGIVGQTAFTLQQQNAIAGILSQYITGGNYSPTEQAITAIANWYVADPGLQVTGIDSSIISAAGVLAANGLAGDYTVNPNIQFQTFVNADSQNFANDPSPPPVPIPGTLLLLFTAMIMALGILHGKKSALRWQRHN